MLVFDWGEIGPLYRLLCGVAWSRVRFVISQTISVRIDDASLAGASKTGSGAEDRTDRPDGLSERRIGSRSRDSDACLRALCAHYGFRPDFCEGADPESKGLVENLVGYVKSDLMSPEELSVSDLAVQTPRRPGMTR